MDEFIVWCLDHGSTREHGRKFKAWSHEDAANQWGDFEDAYSADYWIAGGQTATVMVALAKEGSYPLKFFVSGETTRSYRARLASEENPT